jgi:hypothetical protein
LKNLLKGNENEIVRRNLLKIDENILKASLYQFNYKMKQSEVMKNEDFDVLS